MLTRFPGQWNTHICVEQIDCFWTLDNPSDPTGIKLEIFFRSNGHRSFYFEKKDLETILALLTGTSK